MNRRGLRYAFLYQRGGARYRGIEFLLTYEEWLQIWRRSGKLSLRGNRKGNYVMARRGDVGPYSRSNVQIIPFSQNVQEAKIGKPRPDLAKFNRSRVGIPLSRTHRRKISIGLEAYHD